MVPAAVSSPVTSVSDSWAGIISSSGKPSSCESDKDDGLEGLAVIMSAGS